MTVSQAAARIGISPSKLYQLVTRKRIAHYRIGGKIVFSEADVAAFLESCRVGVVTPPVAGPRVRVKLKHLTLR